MGYYDFAKILRVTYLITDPAIRSIVAGINLANMLNDAEQVVCT